MCHHSVEPKLEEVLGEDIVQAMMKADRVDPMWLRALLAGVARRQGLDRPTINCRSCRRLQGGALGPWSPWRRRRQLARASRLGL
jgi:hypothetical protein